MVFSLSKNLLDKNYFYHNFHQGGLFLYYLHNFIRAVYRRHNFNMFNYPNISWTKYYIKRTEVIIPLSVLYISGLYNGFYLSSLPHPQSFFIPFAYTFLCCKFDCSLSSASPNLWKCTISRWRRNFITSFTSGSSDSFRILS